jgi:hypothetical protein
MQMKDEDYVMMTKAFWYKYNHMSLIEVASRLPTSDINQIELSTLTGHGSIFLHKQGLNPI